METPICQIALSVSDPDRSGTWYRDLGLEPSGGWGPFSGEFMARMLNLPEAELRLSWLRGRDSMSQLELIHFSRPAPRPLPKDWSLKCAGYGIVGLVVADFDAVLHRLRAAGTAHAITGPVNSRSLWLRDPDGVAVEILEKDPLRLNRSRDDGDLTSVRTVLLTVADLNKAKRYWTAAVGLSACAPAQYRFNEFPKDLDGGVAAWDQEVVKGGSMLVRLLKPQNATLASRLPDYRLSDLGILNVAAVFDDPKSAAALYERVRKLGYSFTTDAPMVHEGGSGFYGHDDQGNSVEMGFVLPGHEEKFGWRR
jgi:catechol 2,3-dioxygenase-like lactoylglutathione lyase family enzyme